MGYIFISYSHLDKSYVRILTDSLKSRGFDVWSDDRIDYGSRWPQVIQDNLDACDAFVIIVSDNSYKSEWVQNEVARAKRKGKPFFPLLLDGDPWLSVEVTQYVDVKGQSLPPERFYQSLENVMSQGKDGTSFQTRNVTKVDINSNKKTPLIQKEQESKSFSKRVTDILHNAIFLFGLCKVFSVN